MATARIEKDPRFKHVLTDPRFNRVPRHVRKVTIDPRFKGMFSDKRFKVKYSVDKRGRRVEQSSSDDLRKYYDLDEGATLTRNKDQSMKSKKKEMAQNLDDDNDGSHGDNDDGSHGDDDVEFIDYARGEGELSSSSEDDDDDNKLEDDDNNEIIHDWYGLSENIPQSEATYPRLAVCNMNWDRITAQDLYILFDSFKPQGSVINSVKIYPSDFGLQRMAVEDVEGPVELAKNDSDDETAEGSGYSTEKLRQYQLNRLKYYYAVVECDSAATAETLYNQCDGLEYEHSSSLMDMSDLPHPTECCGEVNGLPVASQLIVVTWKVVELKDKQGELVTGKNHFIPLDFSDFKRHWNLAKFIPDDVTFDDCSATSSCTEADVTKDYQPSDFCTTALQQSSVKLTWDETDPKRVKTMMRKFNKDEVMEMDFQAYLASSDEECSSEEELPAAVEGSKNLTEEEKIASYRALLAEALDEDDQKRPDQEMEITFEPGLQETAEELVQRKLAKESDKELTTWETYLKEKKQKRKKKAREASKEEKSEEDANEIPIKKRKRNKTSPEEDDKQQKSELELLVMENDDDKEHFNLKGILKKEKDSKKKSRKNKRHVELAGETQDTFKMDLKDPRFSAVYDSHEYALDPSNPQYKPTKGMVALVEEGLRHRKEHKLTKAEDLKPSVVEASTEALVKSVKSKVSQHTKNRLKQSQAVHKKCK